MQNTSHAVMAQRLSDNDDLDYFPTPPWATRALVEHVLRPHFNVSNASVWEPACGGGHMSATLGEYFLVTRSSDICPRDYVSETVDFLNRLDTQPQEDWIITNPPFNLAEQFVERALELSKKGVAMLVRTNFIESVGRYERLFRNRRPWVVAQFTERVPMVKGRLDRKASTATGYAWVVWRHDKEGTTYLTWIPPCRKRLERDSDYET